MRDEILAAIERWKLAGAAAIRDDGVALQPLDEGDVTDAYVDGLNDPVVHEFLVSPKAAIQDRGSVAAYVASNRQDPRGILFGVFVDGVLRGTVRLHEVEPQERRAVVGIALFDRSVWGRSVGKTALGLVTRLAVDIGLTRLDAGIHPGNARSQRAFGANGFVLVEDDGQVQRWSWNLR